jgi:MFS transporter, FHS family, glucose/mannose:H+ symporter
VTPEPESIRLTGSRRSLFGFYLCGVLLSVLGSILPAWGHHLTGDFDLIGHHFLALSVGIITSLFCARFVIDRWGVRTTLIGGCCGAFSSLIFLALVGPPASAGWRIGAFFGIGLSAGLVNWAVFQAISGLFRRHPAAIANIAGAAFVFGCLTTTLLISGTFYAYTPGSILVFVALIPGFLAIIFARTPFPPTCSEPGPEWRQVANQFTNPSALLFSLLLFFQFGNEWAVAGWLTLFLIQRLGINPATSLLVLALYWLALLAGRVAAQWLLPRVDQWKVLITSGAGALFGCLVLVLTNNLFGASMGALILGFSFAAILPLVVGKLRGRFPTYHPGVFASVFSFALLGGTLAPAHLGYMAQAYGIGVVMALPALGTFAVLLLSVLIWVEARWGAGSKREAPPE